jgi:transposase
MIKYCEEIKESEAALLAVERAQSRSKLRDRVRLLRLLKSGSSRSLKQASDWLGLSASQTRQLYDKYRRGGLTELLAWRQGGNHQKLSSAQKALLIQRSKAGFISQQAVADYLQQTFGATYTQGGVKWVAGGLED